MSSSHDPVQPTPFEAVQPEVVGSEPAQPESPAETGGSPRWVLPALVGLLVVAALVVFWLPRQVDKREQPVLPGDATAPAIDSTATTGTPQGTKPAQPTGPDATPWSEAQMAKLRKEAQDVLAELLDIQFALQERGVEQWATEAFAAVTATATAADELYRQREYEQATTLYREGLAALQQLQEALPEEVDRQLDLARQAMEQGDIEAATAALELATLMEPENAALEPLHRRVETLPELLDLLLQAGEAEQSGDLATAEQLLRQGTVLDPDHRRTAAELARVSETHLRQQFNEAMSEGYSALDANRFDAARTAFREAAKLQPGSGEAASALQEVTAAETAYQLSALMRQGEEYESQERWQEAVSAYEKAREIDPNVLFAAQGLGRSSGRARLDKQFRGAIDQPDRLSDEKVARATEALLQQALKISPRGPVLSGQITRLQQLLALANTPLPVTLFSDMETEVVVYKVARLGRFQQHELQLRPGTYTAVGQRNGFRDVRREFTVSHDSEPTPVTITCTEPI